MSFWGFVTRCKSQVYENLQEMVSISLHLDWRVQFIFEEGKQTNSTNPRQFVICYDRLWTSGLLDLLLSIWPCHLSIFVYLRNSMRYFWIVSTKLGHHRGTKVIADFWKDFAWEEIAPVFSGGIFGWCWNFLPFSQRWLSRIFKLLILAAEHRTP